MAASAHGASRADGRTGGLGPPGALEIDLILSLVKRRPVLGMGFRGHRFRRADPALSPTFGLAPAVALTPPVAGPDDAHWALGTRGFGSGAGGISLAPPSRFEALLDTSHVDAVFDTARRAGRLVLAGQAVPWLIGAARAWAAPRLALVSPDAFGLGGASRWRREASLAFGSAWTGGSLASAMRRDSVDRIWLYRLQARQSLFNQWLTLSAAYDEIGPANASLTLSTRLRVQW